MIEHKIVYEYRRSDMMDQLDKHLKNGWSLKGDLIITLREGVQGFNYHQMMVRDTNPVVESEPEFMIFQEYKELIEQFKEAVEDYVWRGGGDPADIEDKVEHYNKMLKLMEGAYDKIKKGGGH